MSLLKLTLSPGLSLEKPAALSQLTSIPTSHSNGKKAIKVKIRKLNMCHLGEIIHEKGSVLVSSPPTAPGPPPCLCCSGLSPLSRRRGVSWTHCFEQRLVNSLAWSLRGEPSGTPASLPALKSAESRSGATQWPRLQGKEEGAFQQPPSSSLSHLTPNRSSVSAASFTTPQNQLFPRSKTRGVDAEEHRLLQDDKD